MPRRELRRPDLMVRAGGVAVLPDVLDLQRASDHARPYLVAKQPLEEILVEWERALREDRIAELLELLEDFVVQPRVVVLRTGQQHDSGALLTLELIEPGARPTAEGRFIGRQLAEADIDGPRIFLLRQAKQGLKCLEELLGEQLGIGKIEQRVEVRDP